MGRGAKIGTAMALAAALAGLGGAPARADAIDGDWCHADGRRLTIAGPDLTTPGGRRIKGDYDRHGFAYTAPAGERDGGSRIAMVLLGEHAMRMTSASDPDQIWRRCGKPTS